MMNFCPPGVSIYDIWRNHGTSECFMDTSTSSILFGYLLVFGSFELWMYKRNGNRVAQHSRRRSFLYILQLFLTVLLSVLAIVKFFISVYMLDNKVVYGYEILTLVFSVLVYPISLALIIVERHFLLPSVPTRGHGLILLVFWTLVFVFENFAFFNLERKDWWFVLQTFTDKLQMALFVVKYVTCLLVFAIGLKAPGLMTSRDYLTLYNSSSSMPSVSQAEQGGSTATGSPWKGAWRRFKTLLPFLWPKKDLWLQITVLICILLLLGGRVVNLFVPIYNKMIVDSMDRAETNNIEFRWDLVLIYVGLKFLQGGGTGGMGLLNNLRSFLWVKVQQYTTREVEVELFHHLHGLSLRWHLSRKTGEVLRVMDRGTDSINSLLSYILFNIIPTITDILVAITFFIVSFNVWFGLIVFLTLTLYIAATIGVTEWRTKFQRKMNLADNATKARSVDSLLNFETVKYYGAEDYEVQAYREAINVFQVEEWKSIVSLNMLNTLQNITVCSGLLAGSLLCVYQVVYDKTLKVGDYVLFASYILQLYVPLNWFGTYYRAIQKNFIDMENMFDLLAEKPEVTDIPGARPLQITDGSVEFKNVSFSYTPDRVVLKNVSFIVPPGKTVALVGPSGAGKSTIIRLLFRFYDVSDGLISIDGQNIKHVTQASLRKAIGVVPQDTVLFNNSIKYNIQYGRVNAPQADVIEAAKNADIHEKILTFPESYETQVGERGLKLSGGEKQRVAIARTILKSPAVVLLDEATSALDTQTERNIQAALAKVCANRTTIIVAHRLSTIIHADEILVLRDGEIVERGTHDYLLSSNGQYTEMWAQQLKNDSAGKASSSEPPGEGASTENN